MGKPITDLEHAKRDDDLLSYLFIDLGLYQEEDAMSRKMQREAFKVPNEDWDPLLDILKKVRSGDLDAREAANMLEKKNPIATLLRKKRSGQQRAHLISHVTRYMELWKPNCDFRIFKTYRYIPRKKELLALAYPSPSPTPHPTPSQSSTSSLSSLETEASSTATFLPPLDLGVKANRDFEVNEYIKLYGSAADLTDEQDDEMRMETSQLKADFSVLFSVTKNCFQIFMGPGRFVNHDCNNTVELIRSGKNLCFKVVRPIEKDQEILTFYGEEYFGEKNKDCRCWTCRQACKGVYSDLAEKEGKVEAPEGARATRSGRFYVEGQAEEPGRRVSIPRGERKSDRSITRKATRTSIKKATTPKKKPATAASKGKGKAKAKRKRQDSSDIDSDEDNIEDDWRPSTKVQKSRKSRATTQVDDESDLTDLDDLDVLTDLEDLGHGPFEVVWPKISEERDPEEFRRLQLDMSTGTAKNPLTGETTALQPTEENVKLLAAIIPVHDEAMPSPMVLDTTSASNPGSPAPQDQPVSQSESLSRSLFDKFGALGRDGVAHPSAMTPKTEISESTSQSQAGEGEIPVKEEEERS